MRLFGLIGFPLTQSFSKKYFDEKFEKEGLNDCRFENFPFTSINEFSRLIHDHPNLEGMAVTIPYKQQVLPLLTDRSSLPAGLQACNCITIRDGKTIGYNTDHIGFLKSLQPLLKSQHKKALILGNGGATAAAVFALNELNIPSTIVSRKMHHNSDLTYDQVNEKVLEEHQLIVNTTPLGMFPDTNSFPDLPYRFLSSSHLLFDMVYNPTETTFLKKGKETGAQVKNGYEMLVLQAEENWKIWNK